MKTGINQLVYKDIERLETIAEEVSADFKIEKRKISYIMAYALEKKSLLDNEMEDVTDMAELWSSEEPPNNLYFSHGQYRVGGLEHIATELKRKPTSNRALYSLLNQELISGSGDHPIPSFVTFQTILEGNTLFCTVYFRVIEVSTFLRINLEEIRLNILALIDDGVNFDKVNLAIFSANAHCSDYQDPLTKPKLDILDCYTIFKCLSDDPRSMAGLLNEKAKKQSVADSRPLSEILKFVKDLPNETNNKNLMIVLLESSIQKSDKISQVRKMKSHDSTLKGLSEELKNELKKLAEAFES